MDSDSEPKLFSLISQLSDDNKKDVWETLCFQIISLVISMDMELQPKPESELMSAVTHIISFFNSMDIGSQPKPVRKLISLITEEISLPNSLDWRSKEQFSSLYDQAMMSHPMPELLSLVEQIWNICSPLDQKLTYLVSNILGSLDYLKRTLLELEDESECLSDTVTIISTMSQIISLFSSLDLDSQVEFSVSKSGDAIDCNKAISVMSQIISLANSITDSEPEWEFISLVTQAIHLVSSINLEHKSPVQFMILMRNIASHIRFMDPDSKLGSLITQLSQIIEPEPSDEWKHELEQLISLSPRLRVRYVEGKYYVTGRVEPESTENEECRPGMQDRICSIRGPATHFHCADCNGEKHEESEKAPVELKHPLHPKHSLWLVLLVGVSRKCYCCDEDLKYIFYYCPACNYAMDIACASKSPVLSIDHPKWHEHPLALFPRQAFLTCNVCALADVSSPIYMCPPCDFVVHLKCTSLPCVIKISRHPHRISFTSSFDQGNCTCGVCRKTINNDYGGYTCIKDGCSYAAHSRCATQINVWDGIELEGVPEDIEEEEVEPFVTISKGIIQHFSHLQHHLKLDENTARDYDDNKQCQACLTPIYFGNFYSCKQCDFILHESCANLSRKMHHPIHPHLLTLVGDYDRVRNNEDGCSACLRLCTAGFFYECGDEECDFNLHVQCATISEPLVHGSHIHDLFLTSKPGERRACSTCKESRHNITSETFNCIECDFALCFGCATLPEKVRYKHDKHTLSLSYGKETTTMTMTYWCEACERKINQKERFYMCGHYCCVTIHIECLLGKDLYWKPGSYFYEDGKKILALPNNHMTRPLCFKCRKRCPHKIVLQSLLLTFCSTGCIGRY